MLCPTCGYTLQKISIDTSLGHKFTVDHCGRCGGSWFDHFQTGLPFHEISRLAKLTVIPKSIPSLLPKHLCPRDHLPLEKFSADSLPARVSLRTCAKCRGIWASHKSLEMLDKFEKINVVPPPQATLTGRFFPNLSVLFLPALLILLSLSTFFTVKSLTQNRQNQAHAEEEISQLKASTLSSENTLITFSTQTLLKSYIEYGPSTLEFEAANVSTLPKTNHAVILRGLMPDKVYHYRITLLDIKGLKYTSSTSNFIQK